MKTFALARATFLGSVTAWVLLAPGFAQQPAAPAAPTTDLSPARQQAIAWLMTQQKDGVFSVSMRGKEFQDPGLTAFGLMALQTKPKAQRSAAEQAAVDKGLAWLLTQQNEDGTFGQRIPNYVTCVVVGALTRASDPAHQPVLAKAQKAILSFQHVDSGGYSASDPDYGSIGYGGKSRGDLSNLHFSLDALVASGLPTDNEAFAKAIVFLQRTQNLKAVNDFHGKVTDPDDPKAIAESTSGDDGGGIYYPGTSPAGYVRQPDGKLIPRSYGSMTYALLKAYTLAGVKKDDPRVVAAVKWIENNWDLTANPGADTTKDAKAGFHGLFYSYMLLAQALDVVGVGEVRAKAAGKDGAAAKPVDWRQALRTQLESTQRADGSWQNTQSDRWQEDMPLLCTCYALVALEHCR